MSRFANKWLYPLSPAQTPGMPPAIRASYAVPAAMQQFFSLDILATVVHDRTMTLWHEFDVKSNLFW
ncbi:hypothetical protein ACFQ3K_15475 [Brucella gallinifaecis]|uniref:hypothetical protein n=1 Tax=Brucella gallinifaecis TaxID=215590 RepID=UPI00130EFC87|nr:hypothetical protein [Brucella gallinifaecis]